MAYPGEPLPDFVEYEPGGDPAVVASSPTALKRWIAGELKRLREAPNIRTEDAAKRIGKAKTVIHHIETGRNLPAPADLEVLLNFYGVPDRTPFFRELIKSAKKGRDWWIGFSDAVPEWFNMYLGLESMARELSGYDAMLVHGLFQLREYAEAIIRDVNPTLADAEVSRRVELRMARHEVLSQRTDQEPLKVWRVIDESALRRLVGGPDVMRRQLERLVKLAELPNVTLQVLPWSAGGHPGVEGTFTIMEYPAEFGDDPGTVWTENRRSGVFVEDIESIATYREDLRHIQVTKALKPDASVDFIQQVAEEIAAA